MSKNKKIDKEGMIYWINKIHRNYITYDELRCYIRDISRGKYSLVNNEIKKESENV